MDTDIDLSLDDELEEPLEDNELQKYLEDDVDEDSDAAAERKAKEEEDRLQAIVDRKIADRFLRQDEKPKEVPVRPEYREEQRNTLGNEDEILDKMADDLVNDLAVDPKQAFKKVLQASKALANQSGEVASARANRNLVENYRQSRSSDPLFKAIEDDFDKLIDRWSDKQLGQATTAQVRAALQEMEDLATGRYYKAQLAAKQGRKAADAPNYGGGSSASAAGKGLINKSLSQKDRELIKMGKSAGLSDKEIRELVRENR